MALRAQEPQPAMSTGDPIAASTLTSGITDSATNTAQPISSASHHASGWALNNSQP